MHRFSSSIRRPVKREGAEQYLLITLLSFAASVTLTRLFLEVTGYPQLGGGELHIAHVLWGGLLLFLSTLLVIIVANRWTFTTASVLAGIGIGLFIDEVGKFITQTNDYFHPLAAPIIYAFFLLTVFLYLQIRRPPSRGARAELYRALDAMEEVLEHDLDTRERRDLRLRLEYVAQQSDQPELARLADHLLDFISSDQITLAPSQKTIWDRYYQRFRWIERRWLDRSRVKAVIVGGLFALGVVALWNIVRTFPTGAEPAALERMLEQFFLEGQIRSSRALNWFIFRIGLETFVGLLFIVSSILFTAGKDELGYRVGNLALLLALTVVNLLIFYFDQFSTILTASIQFLLLLLLSYYRNQYIRGPGSTDNL